MGDYCFSKINSLLMSGLRKYSGVRDCELCIVKGPGAGVSLRWQDMHSKDTIFQQDFPDASSIELADIYRYYNNLPDFGDA